MSEKYKENLKFIILISGIILLSLIIRYPFLFYKTYDYHDYLEPWYRFIKNHGIFSAFQFEFSNYPPLYLHLLSPFTLTDLNPLLAVKLLSIIFDFILAFSVYTIVYKINNDKSTALVSLLVVCMLPTVLLNGSLWGQCDSIFSAFLIMVLLFLILEKETMSFIFLGIAFSLKLQTVFIFPLFFVLIICKKISWKKIAYLPIIYHITILPSLLAGRSYSKLIMIYLEQSGKYKEISLNAPNWYQLIEEIGLSKEILYYAGLIITILVIILSFLVIFKKNINFWKGKNIILSALFFSVVIPFFLPRMHERYFFLADILAVSYAFIVPGKYLYPVLIVTGSLASYLPYLFGWSNLFVKFGAILMFISFIMIGYELIKLTRKPIINRDEQKKSTFNS